MAKLVTRLFGCEGHLNDRSEWSYGEASDKNCQNKYPLAMAEKRAKDRVILKLVGLHGYIYSEDEMEGQQDNPLDKSGKGSCYKLSLKIRRKSTKKQAARKRAPLRHLQSKSLSPQYQILT